jgi:hypothetical protein
MVGALGSLPSDDQPVLGVSGAHPRRMEHRTVRTPAHVFSQFGDKGHYTLVTP